MDDKMGAKVQNARYERYTQMVRRVSPPSTPVVAGSTPVIAFGDPSTAQVATLGINPSNREFVNDGQLLSGSLRRLATLESLEATRLDELNSQQVAAVVADCAGYFSRRPYRKWFDPLDSLIQSSTGCSYYDGSACHLDLVQWATEPTWSSLSDPIQTILLDDGLPHLKAQLQQDNVRLVLLNGRSVFERVRATEMSSLEEVGAIPRANGDCRIYVGDGNGVRWVGWSTNLQSSFGVTREDKRQLAERIAEIWLTMAPSTAAVTAADGFIPRGTRVSGKAQLMDLLRRWLQESSAPTIGDVGSFGGKPLIHVDLGAHQVALNADTKRVAVEEVVRSSGPIPGPWPVVANRRGHINKVLPFPTNSPLPGWYAYLTPTLDTEGTI